MATLSQDGDRISLSKIDTLLLTSLLLGTSSGYEIARRVEYSQAGDMRLSNGTLYPALNQLTKLGFIREQADIILGASKPRKVYRITPMGREVLDWERLGMERLTRLIRERQQAYPGTKKRP